MLSNNLFPQRRERKLCASCHIELRNPSEILCDVCHTLCEAMQANLPYWLACQQLEQDENERRTAEVRRLLRTDENFFEGGQR
jgi:hypothetical protein